VVGSALFGLWFMQFFLSAINPDVPSWGATYFVWAAWELLRLLLGQRKPLAFTEFAKMWREHVRA